MSSLDDVSVWAEAIRAESQVAVVGSILGWGRVDLHEHGFRARNAQIIAVAADPDVNLARVADRYEVAVLAHRKLVAYSLEHGTPPGDLPE